MRDKGCGIIGNFSFDHFVCTAERHDDSGSYMLRARHKNMSSSSYFVSFLAFDLFSPVHEFISKITNLSGLNAITQS